VQVVKRGAVHGRDGMPCSMAVLISW
jgi:hypothetical protein